MVLLTFLLKIIACKKDNDVSKAMTKKDIWRKYNKPIKLE